MLRGSFSLGFAPRFVNINYMGLNVAIMRAFSTPLFLYGGFCSTCQSIVLRCETINQYACADTVRAGARLRGCEHRADVRSTAHSGSVAHRERVRKTDICN